uniref:Probetacellulin n=1 Tax=Cyanistes caeruleus TaxID=156563 RepID=A0A8C0UEQ3_CYACU
MIPDLPGDPSPHPPWPEEQLPVLCGPNPTRLPPRPPRWGAGGWRRQAGTATVPSPGPGGKADASSRGGPWAQLQGPWPAPSLWRCGGAGAPPPSCPRCLPGLAFFSCVSADSNITAGQGTEGLSCGNGTQLRRQSHFSRCPEEFQHYCVRGRCRFLVAEQAPACVCERGYTGARCERVDLFYLRGDQGQIVIISLIAAIVTLIILIVGICLCSHHCRRQRRKRKAEEMETLNKDSPSRSEDVRETGIA